MPSPIFNALNGSLAPDTQSSAPQQAAPALNQNFMAQLSQFRNSIAPLMNGMNPQNAVMSILAQRGYNPAQISQMIQQYSAQAAEIQKALMGG
jgi:hypothetical protein